MTAEDKVKLMFLYTHNLEALFVIVIWSIHCQACRQAYMPFLAAFEPDGISYSINWTSPFPF